MFISDVDFESIYLAVSWTLSSVQSLSHVQLCDSMDCSTPGLPVHHQLPEFTQTHVHWVGDAIQPSHPLSSPSPPTFNLSHHQFSSVQSLGRVQLFVTPWTAACQASLSITNSQSPLKPMSIESVMPSNHLILWPPLLLLHQGLSQWVRSSHQVGKVLEFHLQQQNIT